ncbi:hypothetical protein DFH11DRAFT_1609654 [Phellopilus nigrolimitatus]|nr:hypothetical protein DFH11DRAFT_1609654 [Phellopilus nigrolimitatus]
MDTSTYADPIYHHKKMLHTKRSIGTGKHSSSIDSPAYDASEEDNDPLTDDGASTISLSASRNQHIPTSPLAQARTSAMNASTGSTGGGRSGSSRVRHNFLSDVISDDGVDSPTYDGDVETSTSTRTVHYTHAHPGSSRLSGSSTSTLTSPTSTTFAEADADAMPTELRGEASTPSVVVSAASRTGLSQPVNVAAFDPAKLTVEDIQEFVRVAIDGGPTENGTKRAYKINQPPVGRPVRIYADGVYDLFHFGHALQLRQAKHAFPSVYLLVGVNSDELVRNHKARTVMTHAERCEAVRHCRWVDEVVQEAPWVIDTDFLDKWEIDYVAHDEDPYASSGHDDVYAFAKSQGKFLPTRRTPGVSTSELLERIVSGYRKREFDSKLVKIGHSELKAEGSDFDDSPAGTRPPSRARMG